MGNQKENEAIIQEHQLLVPSFKNKFYQSKDVLDIEMIKVSSLDCYTSGFPKIYRPSEYVTDNSLLWFIRDPPGLIFSRTFIRQTIKKIEVSANYTNYYQEHSYCFSNT